ncbi:hypothetical protein C8R45DRAFT_1120394 [Mycena sanguinolenta]|nr:hypothetical protein C8R45DRAFT_1120394 [Mycena sanguinolenta]
MYIEREGLRVDLRQRFTFVAFCMRVCVGVRGVAGPFERCVERGAGLERPGTVIYAHLVSEDSSSRAETAHLGGTTGDSLYNITVDTQDISEEREVVSGCVDDAANSFSLAVKPGILGHSAVLIQALCHGEGTGREKRNLSWNLRSTDRHKLALGERPRPGCVRGCMKLLWKVYGNTYLVVSYGHEGNSEIYTEINSQQMRSSGWAEFEDCRKGKAGRKAAQDGGGCGVFVFCRQGICWNVLGPGGTGKSRRVLGQRIVTPQARSIVGTCLGDADWGYEADDRVICGGRIVTEGDLTKARLFYSITEGKNIPH